jgi:SAM-dependent methyltransferase
LTEQSSLASEYLRAQLGERRAIDETIHPNDEMLTKGGDFAAHSRDDTLTLYYRSGYEMLRAIEQIAAWRFGGLENVNALLDFASGYGRLTRHLLQRLPADRITVSDILAEAVAFQQTQFGVRGIVSATKPVEFECDERFDVIFAASLFTHLPRTTFGAWLQKLASLLTPRGVLIFTTHSIASFEWSTGVPPADRDFDFAALEYSRFLDPNEYGNTYVGDHALRDIVRAVIGEHSLLRLPHGLSNGQDLNILVAESDADFTTLAYDYDPFTTIDCATIAGSQLWLSGWTGTRSGYCPIRGVTIEIGGRVVAELPSLSERADVAEYFHEEGFRYSGWATTIDLREHPVLLDAVLILKATTACGRTSVSYAGTMLSAAMRPLLASSMQDANQRIAKLRVLLEEQRGDVFDPPHGHDLDVRADLDRVRMRNDDAAESEGGRFARTQVGLRDTADLA